MPEPTQSQVNAAIEQEYPGATPPPEATRRWVPDASLSWVIPGPVALTVETETTSDFMDPLTFAVRIGDLTLRMDWQGAEAVVFALMEEMYGQDWTRVIMALCARCPVNYEEPGHDTPPVPERAIQALWRAAESYRDLWPNRTAGFNDHIWGVERPADLAGTE